jgi:putative endonuclease
MGAAAIAGTTSRNRLAIKRRLAETRGRDAESFVAEHWRSQGFDVLARRLRTQAGEIDLIVADPSTLVFIEVKSRGSFAAAAHSVAPRQQARIFQAADSALAAHDEWGRPNIRFDVALVCNGRLEHIHDALRPY